MAQQTIINGDFDNDPSAEKIRVSFDKVNNNFDELYAASGLGGSILSIDQPISMAGATQGEPETKQVADAINARTNDFTIPLGSIPLVSSYLPYIGGDNTTAYVHKNTYILNTGEGTYGTTGSVVLDASNVIKVSKEKEILKPSTVIDMGDIGATPISTAVNNASPSNTKLGLTLITAVQSGVIQNYIFDAADGAYGTADLQTSSDNFIDLNTEPDLSRNISDNSRNTFERAIDVTIGVSDLGRTNIFTQSSSNITIDTDANLFIENGSTFLIQFTGTGIHQIGWDSFSSIETFTQYDLVFIQKKGVNDWIVSKLGESSESQPDLQNVVHVNSAGAFPAAVSNVITLEANTSYRISGGIDIGADRFDTSNGGITLKGINANIDTITSTTTGALFTGASIKVLDVGVTVTSGDIFNMSGLGVIVGSGFFVFGCVSLGTVNATGLFSWMNSNITNMSSSGLTFSGVCRSLIIQSCSFSNFDGTSLDFGTATASLIRIDGNRMSGNVGSTSLDIAPSSANILDGKGWVTNNLFNGDGTTSVGVTAADNDWTYHDNSGLANSFRGGDGHILGNGTATAISTISTPVQVNFNSGFIADIQSSFTIGVDGCFTYTGATPQNVTASATVYGDSASGTNVSYRFYFAKNDIIEVGSVSQEQYDSSDPHSTAVFHIDQLVNGDKICLWVENITNTTNITIETASIRVVGI